MKQLAEKYPEKGDVGWVLREGGDLCAEEMNKALLGTGLGGLAVASQALGAPGLGDSIWGGLSLIRACSGSEPPR